MSGTIEGIHPTAIIHHNAKIGNNVNIGPFSIIDEGVEIGDNTTIEANVIIRPNTFVGKNNHIFQFCSIGESPQHLGYKNEPTKLIIGDNNIFRESVTLNRGTVEGGGETRIGNNNFFMAYVHIAHDCIIGNHAIFANGVTFGGHSVVEDHVIIGGYALLHQHCRVGQYCIIGGGSGCRQDIAPYIMVSGFPPRSHGLNSRGLSRKGFSEESVATLRKAYKILFRSNNDLKTSLAMLEDLGESKEVRSLIDFVNNSSRGFIR